MNKQEFLAMSLGEGLILQSPYGFIPNYKESTGISRLVYLTGDLYADIENKTFPEEFMPVCHPLSDLTKPITHKGETFVPAMLLSKMVAGIHNDDLDSEWIIKDNGRIICKTPWDLRIEIYYKISEICFSVYNTWNQAEKRTINQLSAFQKLISWHFDLAGLIEKGEAIDINTLNENPYE